MTMMAGQQLTPSLQLIRLLGRGAMGSVWSAHHATLGTQVAVKFIAPQLSQDGKLVERFRREAASAARVKSPHVVQIFDHGVTSDRVPYIVMELLEGETLARRLNRLGSLPIEDVSRIVRQTAQVLHCAHGLGIVHRDVKPGNIFLLDAWGKIFVKVLDFGIAKQEQGDLRMTSTGDVLGTPYYMSPEQLLRAKQVDHRADLWALAVVAYKVLTGVFPFWGETIGALSVTVHGGTFAPPSTYRPSLPQGVDEWMACALHPRLEARFASAKEMAEALTDAVGPVRSAKVSSWNFNSHEEADAEKTLATPSERHRPCENKGAGHLSRSGDKLLASSSMAVTLPHLSRTRIAFAGALAGIFVIGCGSGLLAARLKREVGQVEAVEREASKVLPAPKVQLTAARAIATSKLNVTAEGIEAQKGAASVPTDGVASKTPTLIASAIVPSTQPPALTGTVAKDLSTYGSDDSYSIYPDVSKTAQSKLATNGIGTAKPERVSDAPKVPSWLTQEMSR